MRFVALREMSPNEKRVAATPESIKVLVSAGFEVAIEAGAGMQAGFDDGAYQAVGAEISSDKENLLRSADGLLAVNPPVAEDVDCLRKGAYLLGLLSPLDEMSLVRMLVDREITSFALELLPRISRAQGMDALSSQASIAGYRSVIEAAVLQSKLLPMMTTPAGTIIPARVLVVGAGVAGLQAIATARRLGARVEAYDTRPAVRVEVESLGARFIELDLDTGEDEASGGYAKEQTEEFLRRQREQLGIRVAASDVVITTALVPGKVAPCLIDRSAVEAMRSGSVIVDLAAAKGGNCEMTVADQEIVHQRVIVYGPTNLPSHAAFDASRMYSRNLASFICHIGDEEGEIKVDLGDEITKGTLLTYDGEVANSVVNARFLEVTP